jgi:benzoyl-CoA reductase/2-hydroxyglutaryl-CoA dehydratase subunit BcrC/BadD/HgdB
MASFAQCVYAVNKWYYRYFSKKNPVKPAQKVAWLTSFAPVELLEAFNIAYIYPESYAAVIAASGKKTGDEAAYLELARAENISPDCCSYSSCFMGCLKAGKGPRGMPPKPDILIAANNQCATLPLWWNLYAARYSIPLVTLDYPGEYGAGEETRAYIDAQHEALVARLAALTGSPFDGTKLERLYTALEQSAQNCSNWNRVRQLFSEHELPVDALFDDISPLVLARCRPETNDYLRLLADEAAGTQCRKDSRRVYWLGYPFWFRGVRVLADVAPLISGADYLSWWNLDYSGADWRERLYNAYNFTFLNLKPETKTARINADIIRCGARGLVINRNKSCKRDFATYVCTFPPNHALPCMTLESDMIDSTQLNRDGLTERVETFIETLK